ncbi:peptidase S41-like protein [Winogradskyella wandonensis]|uniref:Peptidase S41-like protein n=1 Tax=Winogradskyella wandonensis TaxID=1442586 RepID=A0A4R1KUT9_9FLAO|nr:S41 family peptidase [Winogradskyella wandonensis]TCK68942.1 peptidase S41-like protein [Winogradskyella wandonensis]
MTKKIKLFLLTITVALFATSCFEDQDDNAITASEINDFVWKGMNVFYVYKDETPDLANDRFASNNEYAAYLNGFSSPEDLFESLIYLPNDVDEFSIITPNFLELEQQLQGTRLDNGMRFGLARFSGTNNVFGFVRYVLPNSSASSQGVERGMIFTGVDGTTLTDTNFGNLLFGDNSSYTINLADYNDNGTPETDDDSISPNGNSITLTKEVITENPILINEVIETNGFRIGYLMYNGFRRSSSTLTELNNVMASFNAANIDDLVLDLRYNGGGSVDTAIFLASMISGLDNNTLFFEEEWNSDFQAAFESQNPAALINNFTNQMIIRNSDGDITFQQTINSLGLNKVYVLTSGSTASASELVINGLRPHIEVIQIGDDTLGKPQASTTIYDSEDFTRANANPNHTYALQPLIYESANADGFSQYYDGLPPTLGFELTEQIGNLGVLGDINEPLLEAAILEITGAGRFSLPEANSKFELVPDKKFIPKIEYEMFDNRNHHLSVKNK